MSKGLQMLTATLDGEAYEALVAQAASHWQCSLERARENLGNPSSLGTLLKVLVGAS